MDGPLAVRMRGIARYYGTVVALDGVDLDIPPGQIHGLAGPNGAGKTTLLGLLLGLRWPTTARWRSWANRCAGGSPPRRASPGSSTARGFTRP